jgi:hypothetical protein
MGVAAASNRKIYAMGGAAIRGANEAAPDPASDTWTTKTNMPTQRSYPSVVAARNDKRMSQVLQPAP